MPDLFAALDRDGFAVLPAALSASEVDHLLLAVEPFLAALGRVKGGVRDVFARVPAVRAVAASPLLRRLAEPVLGADCVAVNATLFDKADGRNWKVPYHQDVTIRVRERRPVPGFETWWEKDRVPHVWPPAAVLERMLAVRVHLDDCGPDNGPLRVLPSSHRDGILSAEQIEDWKGRVAEQTLTVGRGGVVLMRPLLLHASSTAAAPARRRVLHVEYAAPELPGGLAWYDAVRGRSTPSPRPPSYEGRGSKGRRVRARDAVPGGARSET
ncbi:MAG: phytanoyl-CoA dioxygenase family protein [Gemmataceae bacterium]